MKNIVITGSSKGIGYGLAEYFLANGHNVVISGSSVKSTTKAFNNLQDRYKKQVHMIPCDVTKMNEVQNLCDQTVSAMGHIDIWINNAGVNHPTSPFCHIPDDKIHQTIDVNIKGLINCSKVILNYFIDQKSGALYNMEGLGSDGRIAPGTSIYGSTKRTVRYFTKAIAKELADTNIIIGRLSPGMVTTNLLLGDLENSKDAEKAKKIFNILADNIETVTPYLGERILKNNKKDVLIAWLTTGKIIYRFMTSPFIKRNIIQ